MKKFLMVGLLSLFSFGLMVPPIQADFIQCVGVGECTGTKFSDIINGTPDFNEIGGLEGDDTIFAGDNPIDTNGTKVMSNDAVGGMMFGVTRSFPIMAAEPISGGPGNDFLSGGPGPDTIYGDTGNDIILPGPDVPMYGQDADGGEGNDAVYVFVSEIYACLVIYGGPGSDTVNLLGFGPYSATPPFDLEGWTEGFIHVVDPISGGDIYIYVVENGDGGTEFINGLLSPNVTLIEGNFPPVNGNCILPSPW